MIEAASPNYLSFGHTSVRRSSGRRGSPNPAVVKQCNIFSRGPRGLAGVYLVIISSSAPKSKEPNPLVTQIKSDKWPVSALGAYPFTGCWPCPSVSVTPRLSLDRRMKGGPLWSVMRDEEWRNWRAGVIEKRLMKTENGYGAELVQRNECIARDGND